MAETISTESSRVAYESPHLRVLEDKIRYADGHPGLYSYIDKRDFALIVPYEDDGFWLVEQYRYTVRRRQWEFPQGGWPVGAVGGPSLALAQAELYEEVGARAGDWTHLGHQYAAYGYSNQGFDIYLARELQHGEPHRERTEADMVHQWFSRSQLRTMIADGIVADAHTVTAWGLLTVREPGVAGLA
ncbi:NUDIX hydrolase [Jatrophihabitans telluris]|uniref:NUDIX hydrolase n=1 Tax=Jatrophihabitans telluris TaxID=2038343 RepID=A0ABY4R2X8_9ACTN|nr:NUDIX hydrolase [Jatrophihabitans telluris]UQX90085.1 NUDIX hydrolase [Jatrophihabitans telluris]